MWPSFNGGGVCVCVWKRGGDNILFTALHNKNALGAALDSHSIINSTFKLTISYCTSSVVHHLIKIRRLALAWCAVGVLCMYNMNPAHRFSSRCTYANSSTKHAPTVTVVCITVALDQDHHPWLLKFNLRTWIRNFSPIRSIFVNYHKSQPHGGTKGQVRESIKSSAFILWGP